MGKGPCTAGSAERLPRARLAHASWDRRAEDPRTAHRKLLSWLPGAAPHGGEGAHGADPGGHVEAISTRSADDLGNAMGGDGISTSQVSRMCQRLAVTVKAFLDQGKRLRLMRLSAG